MLHHYAKVAILHDRSKATHDWNSADELLNAPEARSSRASWLCHCEVDVLASDIQGNYDHSDTTPTRQQRIMFTTVMVMTMSVMKLTTRADDDDFGRNDHIGDCADAESCQSS